MHAAAFRVLRTAQSPISRRACRIVAGVRRPLPQRAFQTTAYLQRTPKDTEVDETDGAAEKPDSVTENVSAEDPTIANPSPLQDEVENVQVPQRVRLGRPPGRSTANRHKQPDGLPPVVLPDWFWEKNVKCLGDPVDLAGSLAVYGNSTISLDKSAEQVDGNSVEAEENVTDPATLTTEMKGTSQSTIGQPNWSMAARSMAASQERDIVQCGLKPTAEAKYSVHVHVYKEILAVLRSGLTLRPPQRVHSKDLRRPILLLQCPKDGGTYYLDSIVETVATKLEADLVRLDSEDIAQLVGNYAEENLAWAQSSTALLSYETSKIAGKLDQFAYKHEQDDFEDLEDEEKSGAGISDISWRPSRKNVSPRLEDVKKRLLEVFPRVPVVFDYFAKSPLNKDPGKGVSIFEIGGRAEPATGNGKAGPDQWNELKVQALLDALISGADSKRLSSSETTSKSKSTSRDLIIQIRDFKEMSETQQGASLISKMRDIVNKRWLDGRNIILVGTTSMEAGLSASEIRELEAGDFGHENKTIYVPPDRREEQDVAFEVDEKRRILNLNVRHIEDMIAKLAGGNQDSLVVDIMKDLDNSIIYTADLEDVVWTFARVHRVATTVMGLNKSTSLIDGPVFTEALALLAGSDTVKYNWGQAEARKEDKDLDSALDELSSASDPLKKVTTKDRMKQLKKTCTTHEKKLLGGVINPSDLHTTFDHVHAPKETVEALKMLTTLSLLRPEAFSYGVLATDRIPGLLLYGPPGTGKTLLAKAVAKESGATVLEISGAEVNDMYVGEGEKNVKAIFSLAKKLSPCVVFIDEADAIFAARGGVSSRHQTHRELINQFLREWDGMNDHSAFIMVATNRPFDLDEAVLRRLPRRLLVDLPVEKDREAILKIHLKDEILDESVSLSKLAKETPFYSGSDLKNLSVAAALACIREENEIAAKHTGEEPYVYPAKRTLVKKHFDKAMEEISASISEDMSTLSAIRKFDEKYGDRKGRRKKNSSLGFGGTTVPEKDSEAGRVRKVAE